MSPARHIWPRGPSPWMAGQEEPPGMVSHGELRGNPMSWTPQESKVFCFAQFSMLRPLIAFPGPEGDSSQQASPVPECEQRE